MLVSLRAAVCNDQTARLVDSRRRWPGMRLRDVFPPHHHGDDERVWRSQTSRTRMTTCVSSKLRKLVTTRHASSQVIVFFRSRIRRDFGNTTSRRPTNRTATGIEKHHRFFKRQKIWSPSRSWHHHFLSRRSLKQKRRKDNVHPLLTLNVGRNFSESSPLEETQCVL